MNHASHPVWSLLRLTVCLVGLLGFSYLNATNFDKTEMFMIAEVIVLMSGAEGVTQIVKGLKK